LSGSSKEDDVWALGVLLYYGITGALPYEGDNRRQVRERIEWRPASPLSVFGVDHEGLQALLDRVFKRDESMRLVTLQTLLDTLLALQPAADELPELDFGEAHGDDVELELHTWAREEREAPPSPGPMRPMQLTNLDDDPLGSLFDDAPGDAKATAKATMSKPAQRADPAVEAIAPEPLDQLRDDSSHDLGDAETLVMARTAKAPPALRPRKPAGTAGAAPTPAAAKPSGPSSSAEAPAPTSARAEDPSWRRVDVMAGEREPSAPSSTRAHSRARLATLVPKSRRLAWLLGLLLVALGGLLAVVVLPELRSPKPAPLPPPAPNPVPSEAGPSAALSAAPAAGASATAHVSAQDLSSCVMDLFEPGTFTSTSMPPRFLFICVEKDPRKAADSLKTEVVLGKGERTITPAMRMFSELGWYEMAFVAAARERCCKRPVPIRSVVPGAPCDYDVALEAVGDAAAHGDDELFKTALARYSKAAHCIASMGSARAYGQQGAPRGGEASTFVKAMVFLRTSRKTGEPR
jgi:hypothetical protein